MQKSIIMNIYRMDKNENNIDIFDTDMLRIGYKHI